MKIVLVEDDKFFRDFYSFKLRERKLDVEVAPDGEEGIKKIMEVNPDVVLLDLIMPKKDRFEVLDAMNKAGLKIPVLVFSTLGQDKDIQRAKQLGARGYMNKSFFDFEKLYNKIVELAKK